MPVACLLPALCLPFLAVSVAYRCAVVTRETLRAPGFVGLDGWLQRPLATRGKHEVR
jgi:hypothetical protein